MNKYIIPFAMVIFFAACQSGTKQEQDVATATKDTAHNQHTRPVDTGYADINGMKMYYEVYGEGKPLVLLHGSFMNIPMNWLNIIPLLAKSRKVIVAEMQGHGRTRDIAREISYEGMADDVSELLKHLKIDSADILGYSMGGGITFQFAVRHPEKVRRMIVLSAPFAHDGWWPDVEKSFASFTPDMFNGTPIKSQYDSLGNDPSHFPEFVKKVIAIDLKPYNWAKEVKSIKAPLFMVIGDADGVRYEHALELFRAKGGGKMGDLHGLPQSRLAILPGTTHIGMIKRPELLVMMVTDFLDSDLNAPPPGF